VRPDGGGERSFVAAHRTVDVEPLERVGPAVVGRQLVQARDVVDELEVVLAQPRRTPRDHELGDRAAPQRQHGRAARLGLGHDEAVRLLPLQGEQQRRRRRQQPALLGEVDLAGELDRRRQPRAHDRLEEALLLAPMDAGRDHEARAGLLRDVDRLLDALVGVATVGRQRAPHGSLEATCVPPWGEPVLELHPLAVLTGCVRVRQGVRAVTSRRGCCKRRCPRRPRC